jgi:hypothetical protein
MQPLDVFLSRLLPRASGCPDILAQQAIIDSAIEFCEETRIVTTTVVPFGVIAGTGTYVLALPAGTASAVVDKVWFGTTQLHPASATSINAILAYVESTGTLGGVEAAQRGTPSEFYEFSPGVVGVYPVPEVTADGILSARVATKPTREATQLDDVLYNDWVEAICAGALYRICSIKGQSFSSDATATEEFAKFRLAINKATATRIRGRVSTSLAVKQRPIV